MATILLFGRLAEQAGWRRREIALSPEAASLSGLRALLAAEAPDVAAATTRVALNRTLAAGDAPLSDGDEIAFMPPMSGG